MKKLLIVLALVLAFSVIFVACNKDESSEGETTAAATDGETTTAGSDETESTTSVGGDIGGGNQTESTSDGNTSETESTSDGTSSESDTTTTPNEDSTTTGGDDPVVTETIPYVGGLSSICGRGPNGKAASAANSYATASYQPNTNNPNVTYPAPVAQGQAWFQSNELAVEGWALLEGNQGDMVWSSDYGKTWHKFDSQTLTDSPVDLSAHAKAGGLESFNPAKSWFKASVDLTQYLDDGEWYDLWVGRKSTNGTCQVIFKIANFVIGEEQYVAETCEVCNGVSTLDVKSITTVVSFDNFWSQARIRTFDNDPEGGWSPDPNEPYDRLQTLKSGNTYGNLGNWAGWDRVVKLYQKDIDQPNHVFQLEGWIALKKAGMNLSIGAKVIRNGEVVKQAWPNGQSFRYCTEDYRPDILVFNGYKPCAEYKLYLGVSDMSDGDVVHMYLIDNDTQTEYCINTFTIKVVPNGTDISVAG